MILAKSDTCVGCNFHKWNQEFWANWCGLFDKLVNHDSKRIPECLKEYPHGMKIVPIDENE